MDDPRVVGPGGTVLLAGASGMIGTAVRRLLGERGYRIRRLVRGRSAGTDEIEWSPGARLLAADALDDVDGIVNLSGASLNRLPWTARHRRRILDSRVSSTLTLTRALEEHDRPSRVLVNGSAVGFYGDRPGEVLDEDSAAGQGFLAHVVREWEAAARTAPPGVRVVLARTGLVLGRGGALAPLRLQTLAGAAGPLGPGTQVWPWISVDDEAAAIVHLLTSTLEGPVNLTAPAPVKADTLGRALASILRRPYWLPAPAPLLRLALGSAADDLLLSSQDVRPSRLEGDGFTWRHHAVEDALRRAMQAD